MPRRGSKLAFVGGVALLAVLGFSTSIATGLTTLTTTAAIPPSSAGTVARACGGVRAGVGHPVQRLISGGFDAPDFSSSASQGPQIYTYGSLRVDGAWTTSAANLGDFDGTLAAEAYCRVGATPRARSRAVAVPPGGIAGATARCGKKRDGFAVSGGFQISNPDPGSGAVLPFRSRMAGRLKWQVAAFNLGTSTAVLRTYVYCLKDVRLARESSSEVVGPYPSIGSAAAFCSNGRKAISGGFSSLVQDPSTDPFATPQLRFYRSRMAHGTAQLVRGRVWLVEALNRGGAPATITAYAYCE